MTHTDMYNTYFSSTIYAARSKGSSSSSINDYSNFFCERFDRIAPHVSSCRCCCNCCALSTYRIPVKPSPLCGLVSSPLLQLSACRRLLLGGGDEHFFQLPAYGLNRVRYELNCCVRKRTGCYKSRRIREGRCFRSLSEEESEIHHSFADDAESILSLLTEKVDVDLIGVKGKNVSSFKRLELEKKRKNRNRERNLISGKEVKVERQGSSKHYETPAEELRQGDGIPKERREAIAKYKNNRKQRNISSCSSYYSFSSLQDFESDLEIQDKQGQPVEDLLQGYEKDEARHMEGPVKEELKKQSDDSEKREEISNQERFALGAFIDKNLTKESEKKLTEVTMEETESRNVHLDMHSRASRKNESNCGRASISHKQFDGEEDNSTLMMDSDKKTRKANIQKGNRRKYQSTEIQEFSGELKATLKSQKTFGGRVGNLEIPEKLLLETSDEHQNIVDSTTGKDVINRNSQKHTEKSKNQDTERTSNSKMKNPGENKVSILSSVQGMEEQHCQKGKKIIAQFEERKSQQISKSPQVHISNVENTSIINSRARIRNLEENLDLCSEANEILTQTDKRTAQSVQSQKGSGLVSTVSETYSTDEKEGSSYQKTSDKVGFIQKSKLTSVVETRESNCQTDERIIQFNSSSETQRPMNLSISNKNASKRASSFQGSLDMVSEARKHVILADGNERGSEVMLMPSSSQLVVQGSAHVEPTTGIASPEVCPETSRSGSSALYDNSRKKGQALLYELSSRDGSDLAYREPSHIIAPEDELGLAGCFKESSKQFFEKVRHDASTSEAQKMEASGTNLAFKDEKYQLYILRQHGTQNGSQSKKHDSSHSSGFSATKGPSDEMWKLTELSADQSPIAKEPEISKETGKPIVKRTGRFLWNIIANVVRLRWASHADASNSVARSAERSSLNKSNTETWFSGQKHEETSKSSVIIKRTSEQPQATTSIKLKPKKTDTQSEGQESDTMKLKDKGKHFEVGMSSTLESGSTSLDVLFVSGEGNTNWTEDRKDLRVTTSGIENLEMYIPLSSGGPPFVEEIVNTGSSDMPRTESLVLMEEPVALAQTGFTGTGANDGEWEQKRLQRKKKVVRDRFDELEEAYRLELEQRRMDEMFMREALLEAQKAADTWEVPVGAVLVQHGKIIARGCNLVEELRDSIAHAEIVCIQEASKLLRTWRLADTTLYVTLEPCPMCAGAILQARIDTVVWGTPNKLLGADGSWVRLFPDEGDNRSLGIKEKAVCSVHPFHPKMKIRRGVLASECADVMQQLFHLRTKMKKEPPTTRTKALRFPLTRRSPKFLNKMHGIFHTIGM